MLREMSLVYMLGTLHTIGKTVCGRETYNEEQTTERWSVCVCGTETET